MSFILATLNLAGFSSIIDGTAEVVYEAAKNNEDTIRDVFMRAPLFTFIVGCVFFLLIGVMIGRGAQTVLTKMKSETVNNLSSSLNALRVEINQKNEEIKNLNAILHEERNGYRDLLRRVEKIEILDKAIRKFN